MGKFKLIGFIFYFFYFTSNAQIVELDLRVSSNNVTDLEKQNNGLFWVATDEGLNVFFDDEKHVFYSNIKDSLSILNSKINKLEITFKNNLIALSQDGLSIFDSNNFNFIQVKLDSRPISIVEDPNENNYWVATENSGYYVIDSDFKIVDHHVFDPLNPLSISTSKLDDINENSIIISDLNIYIATNNGLNIFNKKLKTFKRYFKGKKSKLTSNIITGIERFKEKILIASKNELVIFDIETSRFENINTGTSAIKSLLSISENSFFLRTSEADYEIYLDSTKLKIKPLDNGSIPYNQKINVNNDKLIFWDKGSSSITQTNFNFSNKVNFKTKSIINSVMSNNDEIFFGSNNGVAKLKRESLNVSKLDDSPRSKFLYIHENQYVYIYKNTIEIKDIYQKTLYKKSFSVDFSEMLFESDGNNIFIGKENIYVFDIHKRSLDTSIFNSDSFKGYVINNLKTIDNVLFASHDNGLFEIPKEALLRINEESKITFYDYNELLNNNVPRGFVDIEKIDSLYYVTNQKSGLSVYKNSLNNFIKSFKYNGDSKKSLATSTPTKLMLSQSGKFLYIGSIGSGLFKHHLDDESFSNINVEDGMLSNNVYDFLQSTERLFFQSGSGINFIENGLIKNITIEDGLKPVTFHKESLHILNEEIIISGNEYLQSFSLKSIKSSFDKFDINFFNIVGVDEFNKRTVVPIENSLININYKTKTILFKLFSDNKYKSSQIQYFVEKGDKKELVENGYNNQIQLSGLPYYSSNLNFYAVNGNGVRSSNALTLTVYNLPPWWFRTESIIGYVVFLIFFVWFFVKYREKVTKERLEGERKSKELEEAKELQNSLLPKVLPNIDGFSISTYLKPATEIGGDYYDFFYEKGEYFYAICGDATGHGVISGIMVSVTKAGLNGIPMGTPSIILEQLNRIVKRVNFGRLRMSLSVAKFKDNTVELSSAAMPPTYFYSSKTKEVEEVLVPNLPLGGLEGEKFDGVKKEFNQDDVMIMISDGLPELPNPSNDLLDYEKVNDCIKKYATLSAVEIKNALVLLSDEWSNGVMNPDDITIVVVKKSN